MTFESPTSGRRVNRAWQMPESMKTSSLDEKRSSIGRNSTAALWAARQIIWHRPMTGRLMGLGMFEAHDKDRAKAFGTITSMRAITTCS